MMQKTIGPTGEPIPAIGQGTWKMGTDPRTHTREVDALRYGIELGLTVIDTAEMYADGQAERVVADAVRDCRDKVFIVSKVWPNHASYDGVLRALDASLKRLGTPFLDLYLLHWPSRDYPLAPTLAAFKEAQRRQQVRYIGVSNFTAPLLEEAIGLAGPGAVAANQVEYSLGARAADMSVIPACQRQGVLVMAYSPIRRLDLRPDSPGGATIRQIAEAHGVSPYTVALRWIIERPGVMAIPKASDPDHIRQNRRALDLALSPTDLAALDAAFPQPPHDMPLQRF